MCVRLPTQHWLLVSQQPSPRVQLPCLSKTSESREKSVAPSPSVASSAARLQTPQVAWLLQPHRDDGAQSRVAVGRW